MSVWKCLALDAIAFLVLTRVVLLILRRRSHAADGKSLDERQQSINQAWADLKGWAQSLEEWRIYLNQSGA